MTDGKSFFDVVGRHAAIAEEPSRPDELTPALNRILWAGWNVRTLRWLQPWRAILLVGGESTALWATIGEEMRRVRATDPAAGFYDKLYGPGWFTTSLGQRSLASIVHCVDETAYLEEMESIRSLEGAIAATTTLLEAGSVLQAMAFAAQAEGYAARIATIEFGIAGVRERVEGGLSIPAPFTPVGTVVLFPAGALQHPTRRPLDTFASRGRFDDRWTSGGECEKASQCVRFRFMFPKYCAICGCSVAAVHHYHDVSRRLVYCKADFVALLERAGSYERVDADAYGATPLPTVCEYRGQCTDGELFEAKRCFDCGGPMSAHFHDVALEQKYCAACTEARFRDDRLG